MLWPRRRGTIRCGASLLPRMTPAGVYAEGAGALPLIIGTRAAGENFGAERDQCGLDVWLLAQLGYHGDVVHHGLHGLHPNPGLDDVPARVHLTQQVHPIVDVSMLGDSDAMTFRLGQVVRLGDEDLEKVRVVEDERAIAIEEAVQTVAGIRCLGECAIHIQAQPLVATHHGRQQDI